MSSDVKKIIKKKDKNDVLLLVVDDDAFCLSNIVYFLNSFQIKYETAKNGLEAIEKVSQLK